MALGATLRRPAVSGSLVLAVVGTGAAQVQPSGPQPFRSAAYTVTAEAVQQSEEQAGTTKEDNARLLADRNGAVAVAAANVARVQAVARAKAARVAAQRREAAERAARAAERARVIANARVDPRAAARNLMGDFGFGTGQWSCLNQLWQGESQWNFKAYNSSSGATGIPQALPGSKMAMYGSDWATNPVTQIRWGLHYIKNTYGTPCNAWGSWNSRYPHWY